MSRKHDKCIYLFIRCINHIFLTDNFETFLLAGRVSPKYVHVKGHFFNQTKANNETQV